MEQDDQLKQIPDDQRTSVISAPSAPTELPATQLPQESKPEHRMGKKKALIFIAIGTVLFIYFSGLLGLGYYTLSCGSTPLIQDAFEPTVNYFGAPLYFVSMPFTSIFVDRYECAQSGQPTNNAQAVARKKQLEASRHFDATRVPFQAYRLGYVPNGQKAGGIQLVPIGTVTVVSQDILSNDKMNIKMAFLTERKLNDQSNNCADGSCQKLGVGKNGLTIYKDFQLSWVAASTDSYIMLTALDRAHYDDTTALKILGSLQLAE